MSATKNSNVTTTVPICVRVSSAEHQQLLKDSKYLRKTLPKLLRESYFNRVPSTILMRDDDVDKLRVEINRIGNNINQIAKQMNSGIREGWNNSFERLCEKIELFSKHLLLNNGVR